MRRGHHRIIQNRALKEDKDNSNNVVDTKRKNRAVNQITSGMPKTSTFTYGHIPKLGFTREINVKVKTLTR